MPSGYRARAAARGFHQHGVRVRGWRFAFAEHALLLLSEQRAASRRTRNDIRPAVAHQNFRRDGALRLSSCCIVNAQRWRV
jgi:hypothetical protein